MNNFHKIVGAQLGIGQYIKLGRVWFKVKETSYEKERNKEEFNNNPSMSSNSSNENTDALMSGEGLPVDADISRCNI